QAIIPISDALNRVIGDLDIASVGVVVAGGVNVGDDETPSGGVGLIAYRMHIVAAEQDIHSAQGYAVGQGSIWVQVNVVVRHCDVRGVSPEANRSMEKRVSRPHSVLTVALAKLLMDVGPVNSCDRVSGEGEVLHRIQLQFGDVAAADRSVR